jgi:hypothetical protein
LLIDLLSEPSRREVWQHLAFTTPSFTDVELNRDDSDVIVWRRCQERDLVLLTANRNARGADSLEVAIRTLNTPRCLPVITIGDGDRVLYNRDYAHRAADKLLDYLFDLDKFRGTGRLYIP